MELREFIYLVKDLSFAASTCHAWHAATWAAMHDRSMRRIDLPTFGLKITVMVV
jgi:hypothetical protein